MIYSIVSDLESDSFVVAVVITVTVHVVAFCLLLLRLFSLVYAKLVVLN